MPIVILLAGLLLAAVILRVTVRHLFHIDLALTRALGLSAIALLLARIVTIAAALLGGSPGHAPPVAIQALAVAASVAAMALPYGFGVKDAEGRAIGYARGLAAAAILVAIAWAWFLVVYLIGVAAAGPRAP